MSRRLHTDMTYRCSASDGRQTRYRRCYYCVAFKNEQRMYVVCGVWCVVCGVWCVVCGVWCVVCGVWCVVCGVWCVVCGVWCGVFVCVCE